MSARRIDYAQVRTGGHIGPPLRRRVLQRLMAELCRVDVIRVGADLRVRPQNKLRSGEDRRTHRSAPTVEAPTPTSGSPDEQSTELPKREKTSLFTCM